MMDSLGFSNLHEWFKAPISELDSLFHKAQQITEQHFNRNIALYTPGPSFPTISITGSKCQLHCLHCGGRFLHHMKALTQPSELFSYCKEFAQKDGVGCLISGGCDSHGKVPLTPFLQTIARIKKETSLYINIHTGFLSRPEAKALSQTGIDCASVDIVGDNEILHKIYGLQTRTLEDYRKTLRALDEYKIRIAPHICVGLEFGKLRTELAALKLIHSVIKPAILVIIALLPSPQTVMEKSTPPSPIDIAKVIALARLLFPSTEIALGCMRPRGTTRRETEKWAIRAGVTRIAMPTKSTQTFLKENGYSTSTSAACCVI